MSKIKLDKLTATFNQLFLVSENTRLQGGVKEPFYKAATQSTPAIIYFREDFLSSALHEIAHWCIAGKLRRQQDDYGYWYQSDGRTLEKQSEFEKVEIKPQALEWIFAIACQHNFHFSADNITQEVEVSEGFKQQVIAMKNTYLFDKQLPQRASLLLTELQKIFTTETICYDDCSLQSKGSLQDNCLLQTECR